VPSSLFAPEKDFQAEIFYISSATETKREVKTILDHKPAHFVRRKMAFHGDNSMPTEVGMTSGNC